MVLDIDRDSIVNSVDTEHVECLLLQYALQLAIFGAIDAARALMELFHRTSITAISKRPQGDLAFAWNEVGLWPQGSLEQFQSQEHFEDLRELFQVDFWGREGSADVPQELRTYDENGLAACLDFKVGRYGQQANMLSETSMEMSERLVKALDIAVHLSENSPAEAQARENSDNASVKVRSLDERSREILDRITKRLNQPYQFEALAKAEGLWPLFITGTVPASMGMSRAEVDAKARAILDAFRKRLDTPYVKTELAEKNIRELLDLASESTCRGGGEIAGWFMETGDLDDEHDDRPQTLFKDPATEEDITALEEKLTCTLPDDYKKFLRTSNGFFYEEEPGEAQEGMGAHGMGLMYGPDVGLHGTDRIMWNDNVHLGVEMELLSLPREILDLGDKRMQGPSGSQYEMPRPFSDQLIEIGRRHPDYLFLAPPDVVAATREAYYVMYDRANEKQRAIIERAIEAFAGSRDAFDRLEWVCLKVFDIYTTGYPSFSRYLEVAAAECKKAAETEVDDEDV